MINGEVNMQVFIDAWLERNDPVLYIRSCESGQALFCFEGDEIQDLMLKRGVDIEDLMGNSKPVYRLQDVVS